MRIIKICRVVLLIVAGVIITGANADTNIWMAVSGMCLAVGGLCFLPDAID